MVAAVTGHRPPKLGGYTDVAQGLVFQFASESLLSIAPSRVMTGMAQGWDIAIASAALHLGIPYEAAIPFHGQETTWPPYSQLMYHKLLKKADKIYYVSEPGFAVGKMLKRNHFMINWLKGHSKSDEVMLIALHNGSPGGTSHCVEAAEVAKITVHNLWEYWEAFIR